MNPTEKFLIAMLNDPALMKTIEKMVKSNPAVVKQKRLKAAGLPSHVNSIQIICRTCKSTEQVYMRMDWDSVDKLYRGGCYSMDNIWPSLPVYKMIQRKPTCKICSIELLKLTKEELVQRILIMANRILQT